MDITESVIVSRHGNCLGFGLHSIGQGVLIPDLEFILPRLHVRDCETAIAVGLRIVGSLQRNHHGAHLRVDITEDITDPWPVKVNDARFAGFVKPEVKALSVKQGEDVVKPGIVIGKPYRGTNGHDQHVRLKTLVFLHKLKRRFVG